MAEILTVIAALVSAGGGLLACNAAFRSAKTAKVAVDQSSESEKRVALRQLTITAHEVVVETQRAKSDAEGIKVAYQTLFVFSGGSGGGIEKKAPC